MRLTAPQPLIQCSGAWLPKCSVVCCVTQVEYARHISALAAAGRGIAVLPDGLVHGADLPLTSLRIGTTGIAKSIHVGMRSEDANIDYVGGFLAIARDLCAKSPA